jgi:hypothetical protein
VATDLTTQATEGYHGAVNPYLYSSPSWYAWEVGSYFLRSGRATPYNVRMGRGYTIHCSGMLFKFTDDSAQEFTIERIK